MRHTSLWLLTIHRRVKHMICLDIILYGVSEPKSLSLKFTIIVPHFYYLCNCASIFLSICVIIYYITSFSFIDSILYIMQEYMTYTMTIFSTCNSIRHLTTLHSIHFIFLLYLIHHKEISCVVAMWVLYFSTPGTTYQTVGVLTPFAAI